MNHDERMKADQAMIEAWLEQYLNDLVPYGDLVDAMRYSLLSGGKRIRPILALEACRFCGGDPEAALPLACGVEMIHTYSLIHDDLPCMDDDDYRRGQLTNHKVYGEATALLAGDALLTGAFSVLAGSDRLSPEQSAAAVKCLAEAAGSSGMVAGQILDIAGEGRALSFEDIKEVESLKTGAVITAAVRLGCIAAGVSGEMEEALIGYAKRIGLAFQIKDDVLDIQGDETVLGKPVGSDAAKEKATFAYLKGADACIAMVKELTAQAIGLLQGYEGSEFLCWLAELLAERNK